MDGSQGQALQAASPIGVELAFLPHVAWVGRYGMRRSARVHSRCPIFRECRAEGLGHRGQSVAGYLRDFFLLSPGCGASRLAQRHGSRQRQANLSRSDDSREKGQGNSATDERSKQLVRMGSGTGVGSVG